jgi:hypothetical protein
VTFMGDTIDIAGSILTTIADCRRILHTAQVMQLNTARPARELYALGRLEVWMRGMIKERV